MKLFKYDKFRQTVESSISEQADRALRKTESQWLSRLEACVWRMQTVGRQLMRYRTFNYAASMVGMLFYNGKLLGIETDGAQVTTTRQSTRTRIKSRYKITKKNPVYGFELGGPSDAPWEYAVRKGMTLRTGEDWGKYAADMARRKARNTKGYVIMLVVGMPYADFNRGGMRQRTTSVIDSAVKQTLGKYGSKLRTIPVAFGTTRY